MRVRSGITYLGLPEPPIFSGILLGICRHPPSLPPIPKPNLPEKGVGGSMRRGVHVTLPRAEHQARCSYEQMMKEHPVWAWLPTYVADVTSRRAERRRTGKTWRRPASQFGEFVHVHVRTPKAERQARGSVEQMMKEGRQHGHTGALLFMTASQRSVFVGPVVWLKSQTLLWVRTSNHGCLCVCFQQACVDHMFHPKRVVPGFCLENTCVPLFF